MNIGMVSNVYLSTCRVLPLWEFRITLTDILAYSDADWAGDVDTRHSTSGWICLLNGGPVSWSSRKQSVIATSTTEAELIAILNYFL